VEGDGPAQITLGPDGNLWFTEQTFQKVGGIGRISQTPSGVSLTEFPVPTSNYGPLGITSGPDGNLWFTSTSALSIGRITPSGTITEFPVPALSSGITSGPDGNLWFNTTSDEDGGVIDDIGQLTPSGVVTEFPVPAAANLKFVAVALVGGFGITSGPDGNLWFTEPDGNDIGRITPSGTITEFPVPTATCFLGDIVAGPDGNLWFTEQDGNKIGRITPSGTITEFPVPTSNSVPAGITAGPGEQVAA
jgi:streptogramin lyase